MSTALTVYDKIADAGSFIKTMGREIAASKMFGDLTTSQGEVFALECAARRMPPLMLAEKYHVIFGKLSMKAEAMLGEFHERGGKSRILKREPDGVAIELELGGDKQTFSLTWEEAQQESFPYEQKKGTTEDQVIEKIIAWKSGARGAKQPELKTKYKTPRSRTQMLWARLVSDAVRAMMPEVNSGRYTPEEFDAGDDEPQAGGDGAAIDAEYEIKPTSGSLPVEAAKPTNGNGNGQHADEPSQQTVDQAVIGKTIDQGLAEAGKSAVGNSPADTCLCTPDQIIAIKSAMNELSMPEDKRKAALQKRTKSDGTPCMAFADLSHAQAAELLANLRTKIDQRRQAALDAANGKQTATGQPAQEPVSQPRPDDGTLCTEVQVGTVKQLLAEIEQSSPGFCATFKTKLLASGRQKVAEFTAVECDALIEQLTSKNLEKFFTESLKPKN